MVKLFSSSITILVLTIAAVKAQTAGGTIDPTLYPKANEIPPTDSPEVQAWLKEIDFKGAPDLPLNVGEPPECPEPPVPEECYWTCDGCAGDDIVKCGRANTWGLTFDDGPSTATPTLLDYLKTNKLSGTFFLIGSNIVEYPDIVKREVAEGHHLASHTWSHHALTTLTNEQIVAEMKWTEKAVMEATGLRLKYMRPPYGDINNRVRFVLKKLGYIPVDWTGDEFDTNDWQPSMTVSKVVSLFTKSLDAYVATNRTSGFYCLEHDLNADTVGFAQELIPLGLARNITIANVAQCESDAQPYQNDGGSVPTPSGNVTTPTGTATETSQASGSPTSKPNGAESHKAGVLAVAGVAAAAIAGLVL
ncbi:chitin deacetylase [Mortierella polycephala]|uniref:Chitin deacetylase n=1 Tax=Mortierella polycephala TaxID=41804 RepID=A0A9P6Q1X9_9FUNG|nr:chitin deacetylase [Mortierella polycephala]